MVNKNNILVTGCNGFIAYNLCKDLILKGYNVFGISRSKLNARVGKLLELGSFTLINGNILDILLMKDIIHLNGINTIFHLAAELPQKDDLKDPFRLVNNNVIGTLNLLNLAYSNGVQNFIYGSSMSVYSDPPEYNPVDEFHPTKPSTIYGITKLEGELYCKVYAGNINTKVLRYGGVYGDGQHMHNAVIRFLTSALKNQNITIYGDGQQTTDFVYIDDIIQGTLLALETKFSDVYNIGGGQEISILSLARKIIELTNSKSKIKITNEPSNRPFKFILDINKARKEIGFNPCTIEEGLTKFLLKITDN